MGRRIDPEELKTAWRALSGSLSGDGWRTIPVAAELPVKILAARYYPGNVEAILLGFGNADLPSAISLPQGRGFFMTIVKSEGDWIGLTRKPEAPLDLFEEMVIDVLGLLARMGNNSNGLLLRVFLDRINAWQEFMERGKTGLPSPDAELGLFGELFIIQELLDAGSPPFDVLECWHGPLNGVHDFAIGSGAIEVKTTLAKSGFKAGIDSLDQLDDSRINPIYMAAIRLEISPSGQTLSELIRELTGKMEESATAVELFGKLLIRGGFPEVYTERFSRRIRRVETRFLRVSGGFPRLTSENVPPGVLSARYEINLASDIPSVCLDELLVSIGAK